MEQTQAVQSFETIQNLHSDLDRCFQGKFAFASFSKKKFQVRSQLFQNQKVVALVCGTARYEFTEALGVLKYFEHGKLDQGVVIFAHL